MSEPATILVVEDEQDQMTILTLTRAGYRDGFIGKPYKAARLLEEVDLHLKHV